MIKSCEFRKFSKADDSSVIIIQHVWNLCSISSTKQEKKSEGGRRADNHFPLILICGTLNHFWTRPERNQLSAVVLWLWAARSLFSLYCTVCGSALLGKEHELLQLFSLPRFTLLFHFLAFLRLERERNFTYNKRIESQFCRLHSQESRLKNRD